MTTADTQAAIRAGGRRRAGRAGGTSRVR